MKFAFRFSLELMALLVLSFGAVALCDATGSHAPAAMWGYLWGVTFTSRLRWLNAAASKE